MKWFWVLILSLFYAGELMADEKKTILFDTYAFGAKQEEVIAKAGAAKCGAMDYCAAEKIKYLDQEWKQVFYFNNLKELQQVTLILSDKSKDAFFKIQLKMENSGWEPVFAEIEDAAFDYIEETRKSNPDQAKIIFEQFEKKAAMEGMLTVTFFPAKFVKRILSNGKIQNYYQSEEKYKDSTVIASLVKNNENLSVMFNAPLLSRKNALRYGSVIRANHQ